MTETAPAQSPPTSLLSLAGRIVFAALVAGLLLAYGTYFSVSEGQAAVVTRFGEPVREISEAGPYWKWPWPIEQVHMLVIDVHERHRTLLKVGVLKVVRTLAREVDLLLRDQIAGAKLVERRPAARRGRRIRVSGSPGHPGRGG